MKTQPPIDDTELVWLFERARPILKLRSPDATFVDICQVVADLTAEPFNRIYDACSGEDA